MQCNCKEQIEVMKNKLVTLVILFYTLSFSAELYAGVEIKGEYIPIELLSNDYKYRYVSLELKTRQIDLFVDGYFRTFSQTETFDSIKVGFFHEQVLKNSNEDGFVMLRIKELLSIESNSIYISASYQKFNSKGNNIGKLLKIEKLAIAKSDLSGVVVSPPIQDVKKSKNRFAWFVGGLGVLISGLIIIFGT